MRRVDPSNITLHLSNASGPAKLPTPEGDFLIRAWRIDGKQHVALTLGDITGEDVLVRVHSECLTGDVFGSLRCDCGPQLHLAMRQIAREGRGVIIYMNGHEGRGIGIVNKIAAYQLQEEGLDTFAANRALGFGDDERTYDAAAYILNELGVNSIRLLSNNPDKLFSLRTLGIKVTDAIPLVSDRNEYNEQYLDTKANNGHAALKREEGRHMEVLEGAKVTDPVLNAKGMHIGIVASRLFDEGVTDQMIQHAVEEAKRHGVKKVDIERVYGSGELPYAAHILAKTGKYDALVAFGIILRGGTMHFETVMQRVTHGLLRVSMESDVPIADGVTTVFEMPQARVRAGGPGSHEDRGAAAMYAALELAMLKKKYTD